MGNEINFRQMKNIFILIISLVALISCEEEKLTAWGEQDFVSFHKTAADSTVFSFILNSDKQKGTCSIALDLLGKISDVDRTLNYEVVESNTTAIEGKHYEKLSGVVTIKANQNSGSIDIPVLNSADLKEDYVILELTIIPNEYYACGFPDKISNRIVITDQISRPLWWDLAPGYASYYYVSGNYYGLHQRNGLGQYSDKKYQLFVDVTGIPGLDFLNDENMTYDEARNYMLQFKYWLLENPQTEDNGEPMQVTIKG